MTNPNDSDNPYATPHTVEPPPVIPSATALTGEQFAPCPHCDCTFASKVGFTWWGGIVGPALLTHVKCRQCQQTYNGKTGRSNNTAIAIYVSVTIVIGVVLFAGLAIVGVVG